MTPKEEAIEIFDAHMGFKMNPYDDIEMTLKKGIAKEHALISVNLVLNLCWNGNEVGIKHWQQVKREIELL
jgi:hypothetical protein